jgi:hypothetical protein
LTSSQQRAARRIVRAKGIDQPTHGRRVRAAPNPAFQVSNTAHAQPGAFGEFLLRQTRRTPQTA